MVLTDSSIEMTNFTTVQIFKNTVINYSQNLKQMLLTFTYFIASVTCGNVHKHVYPE